MRRTISARVLSAILMATSAAPVWATQYLTVEEAQHALFPAAERFVSQPVKLSSEQIDFIEDYSGVSMRADEQPVWRVELQGRPVGWFVLDEVYGKHEFITYAVALDVEGAVKGVDILNYRETHGGEVRNAQWREQFTGQRYGDRLKLGRDIDNISGATLSCKHLTEGVRRILALYDTALK